MQSFRCGVRSGAESQLAQTCSAAGAQRRHRSKAGAQRRKQGRSSLSRRPLSLGGASRRMQRRCSSVSRRMQLSRERSGGFFKNATVWRPRSAGLSRKLEAPEKRRQCRRARHRRCSVAGSQEQGAEPSDRRATSKAILREAKSNEQSNAGHRAMLR